MDTFLVGKLTICRSRKSDNSPNLDTIPRIVDTKSVGIHYTHEAAFQWVKRCEMQKHQ